MKVIRTVLLLAGIVLLCACERDFYESTISQQQANPDIHQITSSECHYSCGINQNVANVNNPYDSAVIIHNEILCEYYSTYVVNNEHDLNNLDLILENRYPGIAQDFKSKSYADNILSYIEGDTLDILLENIADDINRNLIYDLLNIVENYNGENL